MITIILRAILRPFSQKISAKAVVITTLMITVLSICTRIPGITKMKYSNSTIPCDEQWPNAESKFYVYFATLQLVLWIPLVILTVSQIIMYNQIKQQAILHSTSTNQNRLLQLAQASKKFRIVVAVFAFCTVPFSLYFLLYNYLLTFHLPFWFEHMKLLGEILGILYILLSTNSIWNPIIYGQIFKHITKLFRKCRQQEPQSLSSGVQSSTASATITTSM